MKKSLLKLLSLVMTATVIAPALLFSAKCLPVLAATTMSGSGTAASPYIVTTAIELESINTVGRGLCYKLGKDIDCSSYGTNWSPIGPNGTPFTGTFDGNKHSISNMDIGISANPSYTVYLGLFGSTCKCSIHDLSVSGNIYAQSSYIGLLIGDSTGSDYIYNCKASGVVQGYRWVGGLIGCTDGYVTNCVTNCTVSNKICNGSPQYIGGLIGQTTGTASYCSGVTTIGLPQGVNFAGGLIGDAGNVDHCTITTTIGLGSSCAYIGGLAGCIRNTALRCSANSNISGPANYASTIGGFVGASYSEINWCYSNTSINLSATLGGATQYVGGFAGQLFDCNNCYVSGSIWGDYAYCGGFAYGITGSVSNCYTTCNISCGSGQCGGFAYSISPMYGNSSVSSCYCANTLSGDLTNGFASYISYYTLTNCYCDTVGKNGICATSGSGYYNGTITCTPYSSMQTAAFATSLGGLFESIPAYNNGLPILLGIDASAGDGTANSPYLIENYNQLSYISTLGLDKYYKLTNSISGCTPNICGTSPQPFTGNFNGNGFTVYFGDGNTTTPSTDAYFGVFGYTSGATISNLTVNCAIYTSGSYAAPIAFQALTTTFNNCNTTGVIGVSSGFGNYEATNNATNIYNNCTSSVTHLAYFAGNFLPYPSGNGTSSNPYLITTLLQLEAIPVFGMDKCYKLCNDLNASSAGYICIGSAIGGYAQTGVYGWTGDWTDQVFSGTFDGGGHSITGIGYGSPSQYGIVYPITAANGILHANNGLFSTISGTVKNINLSSIGEYSMSTNCGGIAGTLTSTGKIDNCNITGSIGSESGTLCGALVGENDGAITNCSTNVTFISNNTYVGGFVGSNSGNISNCQAVASISIWWATGTIGGFIGTSSGGNISNCTANTVSDGGGSNYYHNASQFSVGGFVHDTANTAYKNCSVNGVVSSCRDTGGFAVTSNGDTVDGCNVIATVKTTSFGQNGSANQGCNAIVAGFIAKANGGKIINSFVNGNVTGMYEYGVTMGDITTYCTGGFVGYNSATITNCYMNGNTYGGYESGMFYATGAPTGGFVANNCGIIENCYQAGSVTSASTQIVPFGYFCYQNSGTLKACYDAMEASQGASMSIASNSFRDTLNTNIVALGLTGCSNWWINPGYNSGYPILGGTSCYPDTLAPTVAFSATLGSWIPSSKTVTMTMSQCNSGVGIYSYTVMNGSVIVASGAGNGNGSTTVAIPLMFANSGANVLCITACNFCGAASKTATTTFNVDAIAPTVTISNSAIETNGWCGGSTVPVITLGAADSGSGIASLVYSVTGDATVPSISITSGSKYTLPGNGTYNFILTATDNVGNVTTVSHAIKYDSLPPTISINIIPSSPTGICGWYNDAAAPSAIFTAIDSNSGIGSLSYSVDGTGMQSSIPVLNGGIYRLPSNGTYSISANVSDMAGNISNTAVGIRWDSCAPISNIMVSNANSGTNGWYYGSSVPILTFTGTDTTSGVHIIQYSISGSGTVAPTRIPSGATYTLPKSGVYTVTLVVTDVAGNASTVSKTINWDNGATSTYIAMNPINPNGSNGWYKGTTAPQAVFVFLNALSGIKSASYTISGSVATHETVTSGDCYTLPADGAYNITLDVTDGAGNTQSTGPVTAKWDSTSPTLNYDLVGGNAESPGITVSADGSDALSGFAGVTYDYSSDGGTSWTADSSLAIDTKLFTTIGGYILKLTATDIAGNITSKQLTCDVTEPTIVSLINTTPSNTTSAVIAIGANDYGSGIAEIDFVKGQFTDYATFTAGSPEVLAKIVNTVANSEIDVIKTVNTSGWYTVMVTNEYGFTTFQSIHIISIITPPTIILGNESAIGGSTLGFDAVEYSCSGLYDPCSSTYHAYGEGNPTIYNDGNSSFDYESAQINTTGILIQFALMGSSSDICTEATVNYNNVQYPVYWGSLKGSTSQTNTGSKYYGYGYVDCSNFAEGADQQLTLTVNEYSLTDHTLIYSTTESLGKPITIDITGPTSVNSASVTNSMTMLNGITDKLTSPLELDYRYGSGSNTSDVTSWSQWVTVPVTSGSAMWPLTASDGSYVIEYRIRDVLRNQSGIYNSTITVSGSTSSSSTIVNAFLEDTPNAQVYYFGTDQSTNTTLPLAGFQLS